MHVEFSHCGEKRRVELLARTSPRGRLTCSQCGELISAIDVSGCCDWIEQQVELRRRMLQAGKLGTRKQARARTDSEIDREGLAAEVAACAVLCPGAFRRWKRASELGGNNRGRDFLPQWTGLDKPLEVKQTKYHDERRGFLLVRPPRFTPGALRVEDIDDSYYLLLHGSPQQLQISGWCDREHLLRAGQLNPVPVAAGQRECWGIHWSKLRPLPELLTRCSAKPPSGNMERLSEIVRSAWQRLAFWSR